MPVFCAGFVVTMVEQNSAEVETCAQFLDQTVIRIEAGRDFRLSACRRFSVSLGGDAVSLGLPDRQDGAGTVPHPNRVNGPAWDDGGLVPIQRAVWARWQIEQRRGTDLAHVEHASETEHVGDYFDGGQIGRDLLRQWQHDPELRCFGAVVVRGVDHRRVVGSPIRSTASANDGGTSPVSLFVSQSSAIAVRVIRFRFSRRTWRPSGSSAKVAGMKLGPSFSPSRRHQNTPRKFSQVVCSGSPNAGPSGNAVSNQEMVTGRLSILVLNASSPSLSGSDARRRAA